MRRIVDNCSIFKQRIVNNCLLFEQWIVDNLTNRIVCKYRIVAYIQQKGIDMILGNVLGLIALGLVVWILTVHKWY